MYNIITYKLVNNSSAGFRTVHSHAMQEHVFKI